MTVSDGLVQRKNQNQLHRPIKSSLSRLCVSILPDLLGSLTYDCQKLSVGYARNRILHCRFDRQRFGRHFASCQCAKIDLFFVTWHVTRRSRDYGETVINNVRDIIDEAKTNSERKIWCCCIDLAQALFEMIEIDHMPRLLHFCFCIQLDTSITLLCTSILDSLVLYLSMYTSLWIKFWCEWKRVNLLCKLKTLTSHRHRKLVHTHFFKHYCSVLWRVVICQYHAMNICNDYWSHRIHSKSRRRNQNDRSCVVFFTICKSTWSSWLCLMTCECFTYYLFGLKMRDRFTFVVVGCFTQQMINQTDKFRNKIIEGMSNERPS